MNVNILLGIWLDQNLTESITTSGCNYLRQLMNFQKEWLRTERDVYVSIFPVGEMVPGEETSIKFVYQLTHGFIPSDTDTENLHGIRYDSYDEALFNALTDAFIRF